MGTSATSVVEILAILILLQSVFFCCNGANFNGSCIKIEREALVKLNASLDINNSYPLLSWVGDDCCRWEGVTCENITGHIVKLRLVLASFQRKVSLHLGNLSNLLYLDLYGKDYQMEIDSLHFASSLKYLHMEGVLLGKCDNCLQSINMLPSLLELHLSDCPLSITGHVSHVNLTSLEVLCIAGNTINSTIPSWLFNISNLQHLDLSYSAFRGFLSTEIGNLNSLTFLDLSHNSLEGNVPKTLNKLCNLSRLHLEWNKFSGEISGPFGNSSSCIKKSLENIYLFNNLFSGSLPNNLGQFKCLKFLQLSLNSFWGPIPVSIGQLYNLEILDLSQNSLHGKVSELHLSKLKRLSKLIMSGNSLVFDIDVKWVPLFQLTWIELSSCKLGPRFPQWLKTQRSIRYLLMSNASISDSLHGWFENISSNTVQLDLSYNQVFGTLPNLRKFNQSAVIVDYYRYISLKSNKFEGSLAHFHSDASILDISNNFLYGQIPQNISEMMPRLHLLSFSNNYLNGESRSSLKILSVHSNKFEGIWDYNVGSYVIEKKGYGENVLLYVKGIELEYTKDVDEWPKGHEKVGNMRKDDSMMLWFYSGLAMGFVAGFVGVCSILYFKDSWRYACFQLVDRVYDKLWVTVAIKANQLKGKLHRNKYEGNAREGFKVARDSSRC
ncbi:hypothetical protein GH714_032087 [Hevea brasiliensis]|uniref:Leucine-rich repeat-containing N-terminal plant-type domain-containing protein n=1 Tax=Hevea brasiliensis TaxID=3981 RepID=A0A6A6LEP4_HEVBR|nr:hypothetical protein GH714_032087 [Hevea brasiliensis]